MGIVDHILKIVHVTAASTYLDTMEMFTFSSRRRKVVS